MSKAKRRPPISGISRTGRSLRFDPVNEKIIEDADAGKLLGREYREHWAKPKDT